MSDFKWFIGILILMGIVWVISGGPGRASSNDPFIHQPAPIGEGGTYSKSIFPNLSLFPSFFKKSNNNGSVEDQVNSVEQNNREIQNALSAQEVNKSIYNGVVTLSRGNATRTDPDNEYVKIQISNKLQKPILINGWRLRSPITGLSVEIEGASYLPRLGGSNKEFVISAKPGDTIFAVTGHSPIGVSFRTNICTGYLEQFQDFSPSLSRYCPRAEDEIPVESSFGAGPDAFNNECLDLIERIGRCRINTQEIPLGTQELCKQFITRDLNYNSCVNKHNNEEGFFGNEWRIFLDRNNELWKDRREIIELVDSENKVIDSVTY